MCALPSLCCMDTQNFDRYRILLKSAAQASNIYLRRAQTVAVYGKHIRSRLHRGNNAAAYSLTFPSFKTCMHMISMNISWSLVFCTTINMQHFGKRTYWYCVRKGPTFAQKIFTGFLGEDWRWHAHDADYGSRKHSLLGHIWFSVYPNDSQRSLHRW